METGLVLFLILVVLYTLFSKWLGRYSVTMPIVFVIAGALTGAQALGWITFSISQYNVEIFVEITLGLLLFADAATLDFRQVKDDASLPSRLLGISMPLTILMGALIAYLLAPKEGIGFALLIGTILAPTDAALGLAIFNNPRVPVRIRRALNVESGLNDGIATPLVNLFIALSLEELSGKTGWLVSAVSEIAIGVGIGIALGLVGGWLFSTAMKHDWTSHVARQLGNPALALLIFFISKGLGGNAFVAVFIAGILFGFATRHLLHEATEYTEITGTAFSLFVWILFGSGLVIQLFTDFNPLALIYALLSLTIVRMIPVAISMIGTRLRADTVLMMGWLGPRGLASVVFLIIAYEAAHEANVHTDILIGMASWTILLSVLLHGISALPLANWYAQRLEKAGPEAVELMEMAELRTPRRKPFNVFLHHQGN